jgi:ADP-heptose:LPS heptosyltransferase
LRFSRRIEQFIKWKFLKLMESRLTREPLHPSVLDGADIRSILVIRAHDQLGDFLLSTPALRAINQRFPKASIDIVVRSYCADVMVNHPLIRTIIIFYEKPKQWTLRRIRNIRKQFRVHWDLVIVLNSESHSLSSDLVAAWAGAPFVLGSVNRTFPGTDRNFCYNLLAPDSPPASHQSRRNVDIVRYIGGDTDDLSEFIHVTLKEQSALRKEYPETYGSAPVVGMHIGANKSENRWLPQKFAELAAMIKNQFGAKIVIYWGPKEFELADAFKAASSLNVCMIPPTTLRRQAVHFSLCDAVICNDTGMMHLCASVSTPLVGIFGPTDPAFWKPVGDSFLAVRSGDHRTHSVEVRDVFLALQKLM